MLKGVQLVVCASVSVCVCVLAACWPVISPVVRAGPLLSDNHRGQAAVKRGAIHKPFNELWGDRAYEEAVGVENNYMIIIFHNILNNRSAANVKWSSRETRRTESCVSAGKAKHKIMKERNTTFWFCTPYCRYALKTEDMHCFYITPHHQLWSISLSKNAVSTGS